MNSKPSTPYVNHWIAAALFVCVLESSQAAAGSALAPPDLEDGWEVSSIASSGIDSAKIEELTENLTDEVFTNVHSVLIAYKGRLTYEYYSPRYTKFNNPQTDLMRLYSMTKSVVSLLLGIALGPEHEPYLSKPVFDYFPGRSHPDPRSREITLEHALTMAAGFAWNEMDVPYTAALNDDNQMQRSDDPIDFVLSRPLSHDPGESWYYSGGLTTVIAAILESVARQSLFDYAKLNLLQPLDIEYFAWAQHQPGGAFINASWGLRLRARDLLKIGQMVLDGGRWKGRQIVPENWVHASTRRLREDLRDWNGEGVYGYGYQWWHGEHKSSTPPFTAIAALGYGGQRVFVVPDMNLVVTVLSHNYSGDWLQPESILNRIVAALGD